MQIKNCENLLSHISETKCLRDKEYVTKYKELVNSDTTLREATIIIEMINKVKVPEDIIPEILCSANGEYEEMQVQ